MPVRVEHGEFHRDDVSRILYQGHQYVETFALYLCRARHKGILRDDDAARLHGFKQSEFYRLPVRQRLVLMDAGGYRIPAHCVTRSYRRVEAVVAWLAVSTDKIGIAHGLLQPRNGVVPYCLHGHRFRLLFNVAHDWHLCRLPVAACIFGGKLV